MLFGSPMAKQPCLSCWWAGTSHADERAAAESCALHVVPPVNSCVAWFKSSTIRAWFPEKPSIHAVTCDQLSLWKQVIKLLLLQDASVFFLGNMVLFMLIISIAVVSSVISCIWLRKIFKHMLDWLPSCSHSTWNSLSELGWTAAPASQKSTWQNLLYFQLTWWAQVSSTRGGRKPRSSLLCRPFVGRAVLFHVSSVLP